MMGEDDDQEFFKVFEEFLKASKELLEAATLCDGDSIKQDMISFVVPEFNKMWARSEGIKVLLEKQNYDANKDFILQEIKEVTKQNNEIAQRIKDKLGSLNGIRN